MRSILKRIIGFLSKNADVISAISGLVAIVSAIGSGIFYLSDKSSKKPLVIGFAIALVTVIIALVFLILNYLYLKAQFTNISKEYYDLLHDFRNEINELESQFGNRALSADKLAQLSTRVRDLALKSVDHLVETIKMLSRKQCISGCVKLIDYSDSKQEVKNSKVTTYIRDSRSPAERRALDESADLKSVYIKDNTAFLHFFEVDDPSLFETSYFYQGNLLEYDKQLKQEGKGGYHNTTPNWQNYYLGTAIAPIRVKTKRIDPTFELDDYTLIGFLCIDSKDTSVFTEKKKRLYCYILKSYAALIFQILYFYMKVLKKSKANHATSSNQKKKANGKQSKGTVQI